MHESHEIEAIKHVDLCSIVCLEDFADSARLVKGSQVCSDSSSGIEFSAFKVHVVRMLRLLRP